MYVILFVVGLVSLYFLKSIIYQSSKAPLPPGPRPLPLVGNVRDLPDADTADWLHWLKHKDVYGPISTVVVLGQRLIIVNDPKVALEMLDKKSLIYSDRPEMPFARLCGMDITALLQRYGKRLRSYRKYIHHELGSTVSVARFNKAQTIEVPRFLLRLLDDPGRLRRHAAELAGAVILKVLYGYEMDYTRDDPLFSYIEETMIGLNAALVPGKWLVDAFPVLRHVPAGLPGAGFQRVAQRMQENLHFLTDLPFQFAKAQLEAGSTQPCYVSNLLQGQGASPEPNEESEIKWTAVSLYFGGADTTVSTISSFCLAMLRYPDVQKRAQQEIDHVVGRDRLPGFEDRAQLPYINAIVKEALRWHPVVPMGVPHTVEQDDIQDGYYIPKGSIIMPNIWAFCHDPKEYKDPMNFNPERFLGDGPERDPSIVFGYGRRVCPGRILADANIYLTIASSLAALNMRKKKRDGEEIDVQAHFLPQMISHPAPFEMDIALRDPKYGELLRSEENEHPWQTTDADIVREMLQKQR